MAIRDRVATVGSRGSDWSGADPLGGLRPHHRPVPEVMTGGRPGVPDRWPVAGRRVA